MNREMAKVLASRRRFSILLFVLIALSLSLFYLTPR